MSSLPIPTEIGFLFLLCHNYVAERQSKQPSPKTKARKNEGPFLGGHLFPCQTQKAQPPKNGSRGKASGGRKDRHHPFFLTTNAQHVPPGLIATWRQYKIWVYPRLEDIHALHMRKFQLHRDHYVREHMTQNNQPVFELTKKGR